MGYLNVPALELAGKLGLVIAGHAEGRTVRHHRHHEPEHLDDAGASVHEVADEYGLSSLRMGHRKAGAAVGLSSGLNFVPQAFEESE